MQTIEPRVFGDDVARLLMTAGTQLAPIVSEARTLGQFVAPAHQRAVGARAESLVELGRRGRPASSATSIPRSVARRRAQPDRAARSSCPSTSSRSAPSQLGLHGRINYAYRRMQEYLASRHTWGVRHAGVLWARPVAYFSAEFGLHESLPIYSGGLGILAGDHIKAASDLGIPLVGVGLYYDQGYFRQRLDADGWQQEDYLDVDTAGCCRFGRRMDRTARR